MATTPEGTPYVESSDLVANYPAASLALANRVDLVGVLPFATSAARATAIPSPTDGQYSYLQDSNSTEFWNGSAWVAAGGKILQVVQATNSTQTSTTSTSYVTTGLTASITPSSATSKVLILSQFGGKNTNSSVVGHFTIFRGTVAGTNLGPAAGMSLLYSISGEIYASTSLIYLDSPATTSAQAYTIGMKAQTAATTVAINQNSTQASIILMEVAA